MHVGFRPSSLGGASIDVADARLQRPLKCTGLLGQSHAEADRGGDGSDQFRSRPVAVAERIFVSCGTYESLIYENRSLVPVLQATGMDVQYVEARDGHNWENWRDRLREGLSWLFPGPLLLVYE
jgi:hypothetical protein